MNRKRIIHVGIVCILFPLLYVLARWAGSQLLGPAETTGEALRQLLWTITFLLVLAAWAYGSSPSIRDDGETLTIRTSLLRRLASLFLAFRKIEISRSRHVLVYSSRIGYFFSRSVEKEFSELCHIDLAWDDIVGSGRYSISLVAGSGERLPVWSFWNPFAEMWAQDLLQKLSETLHIPVGEPIKMAELQTRCPSCGQTVSKLKSSCIYCGASLPRENQTNPS